MSRRLVVFDTASLYFRAFFGLPTTMRSPDGRPVNAVRGLLDFIARLTSQYSPTHIACAWDDDWRPGWRVDLVPSYKTHRLADASSLEEESPDDLATQVPLIRQCLGALGIPIIGVAGYEADDVAASLAASYDGEVLVVTGDRDLFQLVTDSVRVIYVGRGVAKHDLVDPAWVQRVYGILPECYVDFAVLRGDPSDGLPGIKGVGDKSAASLVNTFGGIDDIISAANDQDSSLSASLRGKIVPSADYLARAREVVTAVSTLDVGEVVALAELPRAADEFGRLAEELNLGGSAERVLSALSSGN